MINLVVIVVCCHGNGGVWQKMFNIFFTRHEPLYSLGQNNCISCAIKKSYPSGVSPRKLYSDQQLSEVDEKCSLTELVVCCHCVYVCHQLCTQLVVALSYGA